MTNYNQLPLYRDSYQMLLEVYRITNKFARDFKYTLGQDMKRDCLDMVRHLYNANTLIAERRLHIDKFLASFETLKVELRLCVDMNILSINKLAHLSLLMDAIAKQARGWRAKSNQV
ncbi:MAG: four helix bundle protein [Alphaproteobacteria bacterium]|nr:four helix bundle protein [Alphaproteobacteria bacterium]